MSSRLSKIFLDLEDGIWYNNANWGGEMRKRISCRVIETVPLNHSEDDLFHGNPSCTSISKTSGLKHSEYPAIFRVYTDTILATGTLNILA